MNLLDAAIYIATEAHRGELNKHDGELYIHHPQRVSVGLREAGYSLKYQAVAWIHDVVEDCEGWTLQRVAQSLRDLCPDVYQKDIDEIVAALDAMTHRPGETNTDYYHRIRRNVIARAVGWYDKVKENFGRNHLIENDEKKQLRLAKKYSEAVSVLDGPGQPVA
jgi:(p)ppGpp synthase/HD superfamily hydrolase